MAVTVIVFELGPRRILPSPHRSPHRTRHFSRSKQTDSGSMSSPSTPIRAITSTLSLRSAPSIPPPSQTYEPLVKVVLRHRLLSQIFLYSSISTWAIVSLYSSWARGGPSNLGLVGFLVNPLSPLTLIFAITTWGIGVLPVIVFRKLYLTGKCYQYRAVVRKSL